MNFLNFLMGRVGIDTYDPLIKSGFVHHPVCYKSRPCDATQGEKQSKTVTITFRFVLTRHNNATIFLVYKTNQ